MATGMVKNGANKHIGGKPQRPFPAKSSAGKVAPKNLSTTSKQMSRMKGK